MLLQKKSIHCQHAFTVGLLADIIILNIFMLIALLLIIFAQSRPRPPTACFASVSQVALPFKCRDRYPFLSFVHLRKLINQLSAAKAKLEPNRKPQSSECMRCGPRP